MEARIAHEQRVIDMALGTLRRLGYFEGIREGIKDVESFDLSKPDDDLIQELRSRRAQLELLDAIVSEAERAENNLAEGNVE